MSGLEFEAGNNNEVRVLCECEWYMVLASEYGEGGFCVVYRWQDSDYVGYLFLDIGCDDGG